MTEQRKLVDLSEDEYKMIAEVEFLAFDQSGCRSIQKKLDEIHDKDILYSFTHQLVQSMLEIFPDCMMNQFGNYLCQRIIDVCSIEDIKKIVTAIAPSIVEICMDSHGTRVIQTMVEILRKDYAQLNNELFMIINELEQSIFEIITHANGNHVVQ